MMKKFIISSLLIAISGFSFGEDIELYISEAVKEASKKTQVLIIFDNSGSMSTEELVKVSYDPNTAYSILAGTTPPAGNNIYYNRGGAVPIPGGNNENRYFSSDVNSCESSKAILGTTGFFNGKIRRYKFVGNVGTWRNIPRNNGNNAKIVDCEDDVTNEIAININAIPQGYPVNNQGDQTNPVYHTADVNNSNVSWTGDSVTLYTENYLRWYHSEGQGVGANEVWKSRMEMAKESITNVINSAPSIDFGLQIFNRNQNGYTRHGGRILAGIKTMDDTNKAEILGLVNDLSPGGWTPLCETLYEASLYFSGKTLDFGDNDSGQTPTRDTTIETASKVYKSPFSSCNSKAYVILITDGAPTWDNDADSKITSMSVVEDGSTVTFSGSSFPVPAQNNTHPYNYLTSLAGWMNSHDINPNMDGDQKVETYTIGFSSGADNAAPLLKEAASQGGGLYFKASDSVQLTSALLGALENLEPSNDSLTSASVAANNFDRTETLNSVYYAMFDPQNGPRWQGNLKKYKVISGKQVGQSGVAALNDDNGHFSEDVTSYWSTPGSKDGDAVDKGGVADMLRNKTDRVIYSDIGAGSSLSLFTNTLAATSFGGSTALATELGVAENDVDDYLDWAKGVNVDSVKLDDDSVPTIRPDVFGDPLHSKPLVVNYGNSIRIVIGTNAGALHMFEDKGDTVDETWAFMPKEFFGNIKPLRDNFSAAAKVYGIDGRITSYILDGNGDGVVNGTDKVWIFFGLRRGGSSYYAMDISSPDSPSIMWHIDAATTTGFSKLGQTWSQPKVGYSKLNVTGSGDSATAAPVLIFGGGYDPSKDTAGIGGNDTKGTGIYMVDAASGVLKWSLAPSGGTTTFAGTDSIPSSIATLDSDGDGLIDRLYTGDTGGNVWRIDMPGSSPNSSSEPWTVFKLASLAGASNATDYRFFSEPSIVRTFITETIEAQHTDAGGVITTIVRTHEKPYDAVLLGSGDRSNPLGVDTLDRFFMIKDLFIRTQSLVSGNLPTDLATITSADLYDYTNDPFGAFTLPYSAQEKSDLEDLQIAVSLKNGWFLDFTQSGEKSSSSAIVINGIAYFTSFTPPSLDPNVVTCELPNGQGWLYAVDLALGTKVYNWSAEDPKNRDDRIAFISEQFLGAPTLIVIPEDDGDPDTDDDVIGNIIVGRKIIPVGFNLSTLRTSLYITEDQ